MSDLIERSEVLKQLRLNHKDIVYIDKNECARRIEAIPSARPKGEWIEREVIDPIGKIMPMEQWQSARCSICGKYHTTPYMYYFDNYNYCPNCGADMRGIDDEQ